jgi:23S rRNA (adenine2030-N6)-methyltransferase
MNYRHAYHAGNFADVLKHLVLTLVIEHLKLKPAPFRVVDTHAGTGRYDLSSIAAQKTGEWQGGIGRIFGEDLPPELAEIFAPYLAVIAGENPDGPLLSYPGSPLIARRLMRRDDALVANELHPEDRADLEALFLKDRQTKVLGLDGWVAIKSLLPPKERRGVILVDPPFEEPGELARLVRGLTDAAQRFATGTVLLWYPIKEERSIFGFRREIAELDLPKLLSVELFVRSPAEQGTLIGTGLIVFNPPYTLADRLQIALPFLVGRLGMDRGARFDLRSIGRETASTR